MEDFSCQSELHGELTNSFATPALEALGDCSEFLIKGDERACTSRNRCPGSGDSFMKTFKFGPKGLEMESASTLSVVMKTEQQGTMI
jgi:hypothetical protein